jgi:hypothetical protein
MSLVQLPRWIVAGASQAQRDLPHRTTIEVEAGLIASAHGRDLGNSFVTEVAESTLRFFDKRDTIAAIEFGDRAAGLAAVLEHVRTTNQLLKTKANVTDAMAYRRWLLSIADTVISAARTGDFLGIGGKVVTAKEQSFRDRLVLVLQS